MTELDERGLLRLSQIADGKDPDAQQSINDFMDMKSNIERTNLPTENDCQRVDYLLYAGRSYYPDIENDPFSEAADTEAISFMPRKGEKAKQVVELMKQTPNLIDLQTSTEQAKRGIFSKFLGGSKTE